MAWIQTYGGRRFDLFAPHQAQIDIEDIAHALSQICRFNGHTRRFYSVAEHSVRVAWIVRPENQLAALMHDAAEAYLMDVPRPLKGTMFLKEYQDSRIETHWEVEQRILAIIGEMFGFAVPLSEDIHIADQILLATEARDLLAAPPEPWLPAVPVLHEFIEPWTAQKAEEVFSGMYWALAEKNQKTSRAAG